MQKLPELSLTELYTIVGDQAVTIYRYRSRIDQLEQALAEAGKNRREVMADAQALRKGKTG